jgi:phosphoserine phosphatase RsbU/P
VTHLAYIHAPADSKKVFDTPSIRAVVRGRAGGQNLVLLLVVPVSRALVQHVYDNTRIRLCLFFVNWKRLAAAADSGSINDGGNEGEINTIADKDQFGESISGKRFPVLLPATDWISGEQTPRRFAFWLGWTWDQLLGGGLRSEEGELWRRILLIICTILLGLEVLALLAAAWMTRAVTGTVHRLYRATELNKRGDFSHRVRIRSHDQLGELAKSFNEMSANIASLLEERVKHERLEREVEIAAEVQAQLFPREVPHLETAEIMGECRAARGVAGDYYDYVDVAPGLVALALGDVSGKGISASLVMSNLQAALRAQVTIMAERLRTAGSPVAAAVLSDDGRSQRADVITEIEASDTVATMVRVINVQLCLSTDSNRFVTLFLALYNDQTHSLRYTNAGHNAAILIRADGTLERLAAGGMMAGAFDWAPYEEAHAMLATGDVLLVFSDGISEAQNESGEEYGEERLAQFAGEHRELSTNKMRQAIFDEINKWSGSEERSDDQTLVILRVKSKS